MIAGSDLREKDGVGHIYAFERASGTVRWKLDIKHGVTSLFLQESNLYAMDFEHELLVIDVKSGTLIHKVEAPPVQDFIFPPAPAVLNGRIFFGRRDGTLGTILKRDHKPVWEKKLPDSISSDLVTDGASVFVATEAKKIHQLNPDTGATVRSFERAGVVRWRMLTAKDRLLFLEWNESATPGLKCLDLKSGKDAWSISAPEGSKWDTFRPLLWKDWILVGSDKGRVSAIDLRSGRPAWSIEIGCHVRSLGGSGLLIYAGCLNGTLNAIVPPE